MNLVVVIVYKYRVESFIEHQDTCTASRSRPEFSQPQQAAACLSRTTASSPSQSRSTETNFSTPIWPSLRITNSTALFIQPHQDHHPQTPPPSAYNHHHHHQRELQLLPSSSTDTRRDNNLPTLLSSPISPDSDEAHATKLVLSLGPAGLDEPALAVNRLKDEAREQLRMAEEARQLARRQMEIADQELASAAKVRQQAQAELSRAFAFRDRATARISSAMLQITCQACKNRFRAKPGAVFDEAATGSHMSSVVTEGVEPASPDS